ncbi:MAG: glycosyltransferase family 4 protein [Chthoniobacterales bacterium]
MRVGFVVQRCGVEVNGGAETLCLQIAQRMQAHWQVEILTTCALDYMTWANHYPAGEFTEGGISIRRFSVDQPREVAHFNQLSDELVALGRNAPLAKQEEWMQAQGPISSKLFAYLKSQRGSYDAFIFFGYLYATTYFGLPLVQEKAYLAPLGHDEWPIHLSMWDALFSQPKGYIFQTPEELAFLRTRFPQLKLDGAVAGIGVDAPDGLQPEEFRNTYGLQKPFLLYLGRIDASKGCAEMFSWFAGRTRDNQPEFQLVVVGREAMPVPFHDDIIYLGFLSEAEKWNAMAACEWLLLPSRYESLSISLLETWIVGRPAIVNAQSDVLQGHCRRAHGGLWFTEWAEVDQILCTVDAATKDTLGAQGQSYVQQYYTWDRVIAEYLRTINS